MGLLANSILAREALLAYSVCALRLVEIYATFVDVTDAVCGYEGAAKDLISRGNQKAAR
jgi:hypothetical protein